MPRLDIDRQVTTVTVTNTAGGNLPAGIFGGAAAAGNDPAFFSPSMAVSYSPSYGQALYMNMAPETPLTFTFNHSMRNLVMHFNGGDNKIFAFTDASGNPVEFTIRSSSNLSDPPTSDPGFNSSFVKQLTSSSIALGELTSNVSIAFKNPVTVLKMTQTFIRNTINPGANLNTAVTGYQVNFGQYCDQPGVLDFCTNMNFARWNPIVSVTSVAGRIIDDTGKAISVNFAGDLEATSTRTRPTYDNSTTNGTDSAPGGNQTPYRPAAELLVIATPNPSNPTPLTAGTIVTNTWTFGEEVLNPGIWFDGNNCASSLTLKFYKADGVTPLPFLLRNPNSPDRNRQVASNELYLGEYGGGALIQFTGKTTAIVMKATHTSGFFWRNSGTVFLGCNGALTASGAAIDEDTDGDGVPDLNDKCPSTPAGAVVGSDGCPLPTDLSIVKTASVTKITPGVAFNYVITVTNTGAEASNVKASDIVPAGLTINSISASNGITPARAGQTVQAVWPIVPNGGVRTLTINVTKP